MTEFEVETYKISDGNIDDTIARLEGCDLPAETTEKIIATLRAGQELFKEISVLVSHKDVAKLLNFSITPGMAAWSEVTKEWVFKGEEK